MSTAAETRAYRARHPEKFAAQMAKDLERRAKKPTRTHLGRYGLTLDQYEAMLAAQGGVCAICQRPEIRRYRGLTVMGLSVDHYDTEEGPVVRGLLCHACNLAIGFLRHDPGLARSAEAYLEAHKTVTA